MKMIINIIVIFQINISLHITGKISTNTDPNTLRPTSILYDTTEGMGAVDCSSATTYTPFVPLCYQAVKISRR